MANLICRMALVFLACLTANPSASFGQAYPDKGLTLVVPFSAGGRTDVIGRIVAQHLGKQLGKLVAVVNKPGASSVLGSQEVAHSKPDGYTIGFFSTSAVTAQYTVPTPLDLKAFELVAIVNTDPAALAVQESAPWNSLRDLVDHARKNPDRLRIGMIPGASAQIFAAGFARAADVKLIDVPFKGDNEGAVALAGGHIEVHVAVPVSYKALMDAKKVKILAVASDARSPLYGNLPTFRENGVELVIGAFHGVYLPKATPPAIVTRLADAVEKAMTAPELVSNMTDVGAGVVFLRGQQAKDFLAQQDTTYRSIIEKLGLRVTPR